MHSPHNDFASHITSKERYEQAGRKKHPPGYYHFLSQGHRKLHEIKTQIA